MSIITKRAVNGKGNAGTNALNPRVDSNDDVRSLNCQETLKADLPTQIEIYLAQSPTTGDQVVTHHQ